MTDLKAAAEAAKAARAAFHAEVAKPDHDPEFPSDAWYGAQVAWGAADYVLAEAASPDAILALYAERDGAFLTSQQAAQSYSNLMRVKDDIDAQRQAAEASIASYKEEVERLKIALADAIRRPMGVIPASAEGLITYADIAAAEERRAQALTKEPPHAEC